MATWHVCGMSRHASVAAFLVLLALAVCALVQPAPGAASSSPYSGSSGSAHDNGGGII
jgi:hypothetical protein